MANPGRCSKCVNSRFKGWDEVHINWYLVDSKEFDWEMSILPLAAGDNCGLALEAQPGINSIPPTQNSDMWYKYTMPFEGKMQVSSSTKEPVTLYTGTCDWKTYLKHGREKITMMLQEGEVIYFSWRTSGDNFDWELSVSPPAPGDRCTLPETANIGHNTTEAPMWYEFTADESKEYIISSVGLTDIDTELLIYDNCEGSTIAYSDDHTGSQSQTTINMAAGEKIFIFWSDDYSSEGFDWTIRTNQSITFEPLAAKTYGDAVFSLTATTTSGLSIEYTSSNHNVATVENGVVTLIGAGITTITATQSGNDSFTAATEVEQVLEVGKAQVSIKADDQSMIYSDPIPELTLSYSGLMYNETSGVIDEAPQITTDADANSNVGSYPISLSGGSDDNYDFIFESGTLTINKADPVLAIEEIEDQVVEDIAVENTTIDIVIEKSTDLPIEWNITGPAKFSEDEMKIHLTGTTGTVALKAVQEGNDNYNSTSANISFDVLIVTSVELSEKYDIVVYPNPVDDKINVSSADFEEVSLINLKGEVVLKVVLSDDKEQVIEVSSLEGGVYFLRFSKGAEIHTKKMVIAR